MERSEAHDSKSTNETKNELQFETDQHDANNQSISRQRSIGENRKDLKRGATEASVLVYFKAFLCKLYVD